MDPKQDKIHENVKLHKIDVLKPKVMVITMLWKNSGKELALVELGNKIFKFPTVDEPF